MSEDHVRLLAVSERWRHLYENARVGWMKLAEERGAEVERLRFLMECADTPLMRDVLSERDEARAEVERLRHNKYCSAGGWPCPLRCDEWDSINANAQANDLQAEVERLRVENAALREAAERVESIRRAVRAENKALLVALEEAHAARIEARDRGKR